ncbi:MAG: hypothetical protein NTX86_05450 [Candidatus Dependentiae bacterium]|nr:hypothetical protein [Candidatus Dependentiae bacterium]
MRKYLIGFLVALPAHGSISIVYNLRVAQTSRRIVAGTISEPSLATATLFGIFREKYNGDKHRAGGGLFTLVYAPETFFLRVDAAVGRVASNNAGVHFGRTQTDDLLFSGGYSPRISDNVRLTFSGLVGFPTHKDTSLEHVQFGFGHYGLGGQIDGSFIYSSNRGNTVRCAARCVHFFPRQAPVNCLESFNYGLGNLVDLFFAFHATRTRHNMEVGYNPSFFFDAHVCPFLLGAKEKANYIRNSFYGLYRCSFNINEMTHSITTALSYGFDTRPKVVGNKRSVTVWSSWRVDF